MIVESVAPRMHPSLAAFRAALPERSGTRWGQPIWTPDEATQVGQRGDAWSTVAVLSPAAIFASALAAGAR